MTQATDTAVPYTPSPLLRARAAIAAEWIKLRSLRSIPVTLAVTVVLCIGFADLVSSNNVTNWKTLDAAGRAAFDPFFVSINFVQIGVIFFGVLGALVVTNEYGTGLIRTTLAATPQRGLVLAAKTGLLGLVALLASSVVCLIAFLTGQAILSGHVPSVGLGDPGVAGHLLGAICYLTAAGLMGVFIGVLSRSTAISFTTVFGLFLVLPILVDKLPHNAAWQRVGPYLPSNAGASLWDGHVQDFLRPTTAALTLVAYLVVLGTAAVVSLRSRDV
jgi:ABC-type transport system involved in multi-copper enzyme maturation permease subunit